MAADRPAALPRSAGAGLFSAIGFVGMCLIWGTTLFVIKLGLDGGWSPLWFAAVRFLIAGAIMLPWLATRASGPRLGLTGLRAVLPVALTGVALHYGLVFWGEQYIGAGLASLIAATQPVTTVLIDAWMTRRGIRLRTIAGLLTGSAGIVLVVGSASLPGATGILGALAVLAGVTAFGWSTVYSVHRLGGLPLGRVILAENLVGGLLLAAAAIVVEGPPRVPTTAGPWAAILYLAAVASVLGLLGALWLARRIGARRLSMTSYVTPLIGVLAGMIWLGESFRWPVVVGAALLAAALSLILGDRGAQRRPQ